MQIKILKTVGLLNLLNTDDLQASEASIICAMASESVTDKDVKTALENLRQKKRVLYDRGRARGLCLWPHTSVDLENAFEEARRAVSMPNRVAGLINEYLETRPIVARRHYIETGNLRYFDVRYCSATELKAQLEGANTEADGLIIVALCETQQERTAAIEFSKRPELAKCPNWLVAVPQPLANLANLLQEVLRWDWVLTHTEELNADKYGREEAIRQAEAASSQLQKRVQDLLGFKRHGGKSSLEWFNRAKPLQIKDGRQLLQELSRIFDETYTHAPRVHNELANRRSLSSAAAAARMRLIERIFTNAAVPLLGMDENKKPPEMSIYLSLLQNTGIHHKHESKWRIGKPDERADKAKLLPAFQRINDLVQQAPGIGAAAEQVDGDAVAKKVGV